MSTSVCALGSISMDFVVRAPRFAEPGETVMGEGFEQLPGGKGANQAVAASRLGAQVSLIGCVGADDRGAEMRGVLASEGVDITRVRQNEKSPTGVGVITVVPDGEHEMVLVPGANARMTVKDVDDAAGVIAEAAVLLLQADMPEEANLRAIEIAKKSNTAIVFNASPAEGMNLDLLHDVDILVLSRAEASALLGDDCSDVAATGLARRLASYGPDRVVLTLGDEGALHFNGEEIKTTDPHDVECIDATGAGDAFVAALATLRAEGARVKDAVRFACAAGALATTVVGAIPALPTREAVENLLKREVGAAG
jgi:ribokinase